jgi:hypothetical protein
MGNAIICLLLVHLSPVFLYASPIIPTSSISRYERH